MSLSKALSSRSRSGARDRSRIRKPSKIQCSDGRDIPADRGFPTGDLVIIATIMRLRMSTPDHPACEPLAGHASCRGCGKAFACGEAYLIPYPAQRKRYAMWHPGCGPTGRRLTYHCSKLLAAAARPTPRRAPARADLQELRRDLQVDPARSPPLLQRLPSVRLPAAQGGMSG
jgi:hypothetical protein